MRQTSSPTIGSASRTSPSSRNPVAKSQCTISAGGCIVLLEIGDERPCDDEPERDAGGDEEQGRLDREPPESLAARVQKRYASGLCDRPHEACQDGHRPE